MPGLIRALGDEDEGVREEAISSIMRLETAAAPAESAVRRALGDPSPAVRRAAETALRTIAGMEKVGFYSSADW